MITYCSVYAAILGNNNLALYCNPVELLKVYLLIEKFYFLQVKTCAHFYCKHFNTKFCVIMTGQLPDVITSSCNNIYSYYRTQEEMGHTCRGTVNLAGAFIDKID